MKPKITFHGKTNSPNHASRKKYRVPSSKVTISSVLNCIFVATVISESRLKEALSSLLPVTMKARVWYMHHPYQRVDTEVSCLDWTTNSLGQPLKVDQNLTRSPNSKSNWKPDSRIMNSRYVLTSKQLNTAGMEACLWLGLMRSFF